MQDITQKAGAWFTVSGVILILLGAAAIALPLTASLTIEALFGWILTISGIVKIIHSLKARDSGRCTYRLLGGIFYLIAGIIFLAHPMQGLLIMIFALAFLFMFDGIIKIALSMRLKPLPGWGWMLASGLASLALSGIIWANWPDSVSWVLGLLVGINLIFSGITMLMVSAAVRTI